MMIITETENITAEFQNWTIFYLSRNPIMKLLNIKMIMRLLYNRYNTQFISQVSYPSVHLKSFLRGNVAVDQDI
jgi:hypothetical protein